MIQLGAGFVASIIIARVLGPEEKGVYSLAFLFQGLMVNFLDVGIGRSTVYHVGKKMFSLKELLGANIALSSLIGIVSMAAGTLFVFFLDKIIFPDVPKKYLLLALMLVPLYLFLNYIVNIFLGLQKIKIYNFFQSSLSLLLLVFLLVLLFFGKITITAAIISQILAYLFSIAAAFFAAKTFAAGFCLPRELAIYKSIIGYGFKSYLGNIITFFQYRINMFLISIFLNPLAVGFYSIAAGLAEQIWIISEASGSMLFARVVSETDGKKLKEFTPMICRNVIFATFAMCVFLFFIGPSLITFFYSFRFYDSVAPFRILMVGIVAMSGWRILSNDLYGRGLPMINAFISAFSIVFTVALGVLIIPIWGIIGAAWATSLSYALVFILVLFIYKKISQNAISDIIFIKKTDLNLQFNILLSAKDKCLSFLFRKQIK